MSTTKGEQAYTPAFAVVDFRIVFPISIWMDFTCSKSNQNGPHYRQQNPYTSHRWNVNWKRVSVKLARGYLSYYKTKQLQTSTRRVFACICCMQHGLSNNHKMQKHSIHRWQRQCNKHSNKTCYSWRKVKVSRKLWHEC